MQSTILRSLHWLFHDGGRYHIETSPFNCYANQWTGFYMITASVMKELNGRLFEKERPFIFKNHGLKMCHIGFFISGDIFMIWNASVCCNKYYINKCFGYRLIFLQIKSKIKMYKKVTMYYHLSDISDIIKVPHTNHIVVF